MKAKVHVTLKSGVLDPQGKAVQHALDALGFGGVDEVRQGKYIELELAETAMRSPAIPPKTVELATPLPPSLFAPCMPPASSPAT